MLSFSDINWDASTVDRWHMMWGPCSKGNRTRASASLCKTDPENCSMKLEMYLDLFSFVNLNCQSYRGHTIVSQWMLTRLNWINYFERLSLLAESSLRDTCEQFCLFNILKTQQGWSLMANNKGQNMFAEPIKKQIFLFVLLQLWRSWHAMML